MFWGLKSEIGEKVGYKHVWCNQCDCQRLANQFKQKTKLTIFWVPTIPVVSESVWRCSHCEEDPNKLTGLSKLKDVLLLLLAVAAVIVVFGGVVGHFIELGNQPHPLISLVSFIYLLFAVKRTMEQKNPIHEVGSPNQVIPVSQINCVYCDGILESRPKLHCPSCMLNVHI